MIFLSEVLVEPVNNFILTLVSFNKSEIELKCCVARISVGAIIPVSYTHLDVYKRQALAETGKKIIIYNVPGRTGQNLEASTTVSYTHLDVYKRQLQIRAFHFY